MKITVMLFMCCCMMTAETFVSAEEQQDRIRAKIGIQIRTKTGESRLAKASDKLKAKNQLAIYLQPESDPAYIYILHSSEKKSVTWLNQGIQYKVVMNNILRIPERAFFDVDGNSSLEEIIILCSPVELPKLEILLKSKSFSYSEWTEYEQDLKKKLVDLSDPLDKPLNIGGNVRPLPDTFWDDQNENMHIFSGNSLVMATFTFLVKTE